MKPILDKISVLSICFHKLKETNSSNSLYSFGDFLENLSEQLFDFINQLNLPNKSDHQKNKGTTRNECRYCRFLDNSKRGKRTKYYCELCPTYKNNSLRLCLQCWDSAHANKKFLQEMKNSNLELPKQKVQAV